MARQKSFGDILREARERKGMDVPTAARRLRIRPDILQVIECADFSRMPPRGYTRNMVHAYARMVGLNPTDLTRMYLDDDHSYQLEQQRGAAERYGQAGRQIDLGSRQERPGRRGTSNRDDRVLYDSRTSGSRANGSTRTGQSQNLASSPYRNLYSGSASSSLNKSKAPFIVIAAVLVLVVVLVAVFVLGGKDDEDTHSGDSDVIIPGVHDTSNPDTGEIDPTVMQGQQIVITPDLVTFVYAVPAGSSAYIEVYESEGGSPTVAKTVEGPSEKAFDVTETLTFVTTNPRNVVITEGGKVVEPTDDNGDGVYIYEVNFDTYLAAWKAEHQPKNNEGADSGANADNA